MLSKDSKNINIKIDNPEKLKITIVVSEWHSEITDKLFKGAKNVLTDNGLLEENINRVNVPGSFELIYGCRMAQNNDQDAVIAIGCIIKGETPHFDFISNAVFRFKRAGMKFLVVLSTAAILIAVGKVSLVD